MGLKENIDREFEEFRSEMESKHTTTEFEGRTHYDSCRVARAMREVPVIFYGTTSKRDEKGTIIKPGHSRGFHGLHDNKCILYDPKRGRIEEGVDLISDVEISFSHPQLVDTFIEIYKRDNKGEKPFRIKTAIVPEHRIYLKDFIEIPSDNYLSFDHDLYPDDEKIQKVKHEKLAYVRKMRDAFLKMVKRPDIQKLIKIDDFEPLQARDDLTDCVLYVAYHAKKYGKSF